MAKEYLDKSGLTYLWGKLKNTFLLVSNKYTRSNAGTLDWTSTADGDAKVIMKSALAFWNGAYSGTSSTLKYCNNGEMVGTNNLDAKLKALSPQNVTFTACGKTWSFNRIGKVVYIDAPTDVSSAVAGMNVLGTLPTGMRPSFPLQLHTGNNTNDFRLTIGTDGVTQFYTPYAISGGTNCCFSGYSYIAGN